jgi:hypothetical protein
MDVTIRDSIEQKRRQRGCDDAKRREKGREKANFQIKGQGLTARNMTIM